MNRIAEILSRLTRCRRGRRAAGLLMLALFCTGCGPGTGGTGVGPTPGTYVLPSGAGPVTPGAPIAADYVAVFSDTGIRVTGACFEFVHEGPWQLDADEILRVGGRYRSVASGGDLGTAPFQPAELAARAGADGLEITVVDARGVVLLQIRSLSVLAEGQSAAMTPACGPAP